MITIKSINGKTLYEGDHPSLGDAIRYCIANEISLDYAQLPGVDLSGLNLSGDMLARFQADHANFDGAKFSKTLCCHASFRHASFVGADLSESIFSFASCVGADFSEANLIRANFFKSDVSGALFRSADLRLANFESAQWTGAIFYRAILNGLILKEPPCQSAPGLIVAAITMEEFSKYVATLSASLEKSSGGNPTVTL